jgi:hypothetical protein
MQDLLAALQLLGVLAAKPISSQTCAILSLLGKESSGDAGTTQIKPLSVSWCLWDPCSQHKLWQGIDSS